MAMPVTAVDCHAHVLDNKYVLSKTRNYNPDGSQIGNTARFLSVLDAHGLSHGLLVAAEPYGFDNQCMLDGIAQSNGRLKGIALVSPDISDHDLEALCIAGVVGVRYNLTSFGMTQFKHPATERLFARLAELGLFLQIHCQHNELVEVMPYLQMEGLRVMIDHFGRPDMTQGVDQPGFQAALELGRSGNSVVKLSGPFRCSHELPPYNDVTPFISAAIDAFTIDNCVWGSDWPFVRVTERIDYGPEYSCLANWLPDARDQKKILADNPARLFGFS